MMREIDWSIGEIMKALKTNGLDDNTLLILTSDNGPWTVYGDHSGKTPYREAKGTGFDGGTRSACLMRYPGQIKANTVSKKTLCSIDLLPTIASLTGAKLPDAQIDGKNVWDLVTNKSGASNPHEYYAFSTAAVFEGVMSGDGRWKLHLPHQYRGLPRWEMAARPANTARSRSSSHSLTCSMIRWKPRTLLTSTRMSPLA